jgi:xanthosine utilization system XapX-like protein
MERLLSRALISMAAAVAAIILAAIAVMFLGGALYLLLVSMSATPPLAALLVGLVGLVLVALIILVARIATRRSRTSVTTGRTGSADAGLAGNVNELAANLGSLAARKLTSQAQAHPYRTVLVSLIAGLAVGGSPELRNMIEKMLKN